MKLRKIVFLITVSVMLLSSVAANAVEVTPYLKIARDYEASAIKARKNWVGKTICIEAEVYRADVNDKGDAVVWVAREDKPNSLIGVTYFFFFEGIPDEVTEIETGDTVKISGKVFDLQTNKNMLIVRSVSSHIVE